MVWIKICGTTNVEDARAAVAAGADALGFVFAESPRRVDPEAARDIVAELPPQVEKVGVFVNETADRIREVSRRCGLTAVQLHGEEELELVRALAADSGVKVIKAIAVRGGFGARVLAYTDAGANAVLLDSATLRRGGSGKPFDWRAVAAYMPRHEARVIVAGGLNPENVRDPVRMIRPWGVDVVSGVEREPGKKDPEKLAAFVAAVRRAEVER